MDLIFVRHGESIWNKENLFTGWTDVDLSENGKREAIEAGRSLKIRNFDIDICYTSYLKRAIHTLNYILSELDREWLPVIKTWKLNERHYGALQGLNKFDTSTKYGNDQVEKWRRSYDIRPPPLEEDDERNPIFSPMYRHEDKSQMPLSESLADTMDRVVPYYIEEILPKIEMGMRVLVVAHGNSLRALVKYIEHITDDGISKVNIPTGVPLVYNFDDDMKLVDKKYLNE